MQSSQEEHPPELSLLPFTAKPHPITKDQDLSSPLMSYIWKFLYCCYSHNPVLRQTMISCLQRNFRFLLGLANTWLRAGSLLRTQKYKISYSPYKNSHQNMIRLKKKNPTFRIPTHSTKTTWSPGHLLLQKTKQATVKCYIQHEI